MHIRAMQYDDIDFAVRCTAAEGWTSEGRQDFEAFLNFPRSGCFVMEDAGTPVGMIIANTYGQDGFIGELIVLPAYRGQQIGRRLMDHAVRYLRSVGTENIFLDGVIKAISLYERVGFRKVCRSLRFTGAPQGRDEPEVRLMTSDDLPAVYALDRAAFGADRAFVLARRFETYPQVCYVLEEQGKITGFVMAKPGPEVVAVGPWCILPAAEHPEKLLLAVAQHRQTAYLRLGILESNQRACHLANALGFRESEAPSWRMVLGLSDRLGRSERSLAVGSPAMG